MLVEIAVSVGIICVVVPCENLVELSVVVTLVYKQRP